MHGPQQKQEYLSENYYGDAYQRRHYSWPDVSAWGLLSVHVVPWRQIKQLTTRSNNVLLLGVVWFQGSGQK